MAASLLALVVPYAGEPRVSLAQGLQCGPDLIGDLQSYRVSAGESLMEIARKFDLGINALAAANPGIDRWVPAPGTVITIPTAWILPDESLRHGLVINLPELRLYYFPPGPSAQLLSFPLGIGAIDTVTPTGSYTVVKKLRQPTWRVPASIRKERSDLPAAVPPGPDNPLGSHALSLSRFNLMIHGTNRPWGIGMRSSHGCLRLYPEDIVTLFKTVPTGTTVTIVEQPIKACSGGDKVFLEVHRPFTSSSDVGDALHLLSERKLLRSVDFTKLIRAVEEMKGVPVDITLEP